MKKLFRVALSAAMLAVFAFTSACKDHDPEIEENDETKIEIIRQCVNHTIAPTYKNLAEQADQLVEKLKSIQSEPADSNVAAACETFLKARAWWEKSEAFLFGAATDFGIDPHIDSWPLDLDALQIALSNTQQVEAMAGEDGDVFAGENLGNALLGFHGVEYILFNEGRPRAAAEIPDLSLVYAIAVAGDLRNRCFQLEASWAGEAQTAPAHLEKVKELDLNYTLSGSNNSYGENMLQAGKAGSSYFNATDALTDLVEGCCSIADEVATSKIGKPFNGEDIHYIESPYSQTSITDFHDNIISIQNVYMGGLPEQRDEALSLHALVKDLDSDLDAQVIAAISNALTEIDGMPKPFVNNFTDPSVGKAIEACQNLDEALAKIKTTLSNNF